MPKHRSSKRQPRRACHFSRGKMSVLHAVNLCTNRFTTTARTSVAEITDSRTEFLKGLLSIFFMEVFPQQIRQIMPECFGRLAGGFCRCRGEVKKPAHISKRRPDETESNGAEISTKQRFVGFTLSKPYPQHSRYLTVRVSCKTRIIGIVIIDDSVRTCPYPCTSLFNMKKYISHLRHLQ